MEEAVTLADRVILIEEGQVVLNKKIDLPRPRKKDTVMFATLVTQILNRVLQIDDSERKKAIHA